MASIDPAAAQAEKEARLVEARRAKAKAGEAVADGVGLALSGGGVRSATFCLGVLRGLAKAGTLRHFDYLSTVSGGGYIGSAYARLYGPNRSPEDIEKALARDDSVFLWWLRNNGRYLTPAGLRDLLQAFASIFRGALSTHFEVGMLLVLCAAGLVLPSLLLPLPLATDMRDGYVSAWFWIGLLPLFIAFHSIFSYWFWRSEGAAKLWLLDVAVGLAGVAIAWRWAPDVAAWLQARGPRAAGLGAAALFVLLFSPGTAAVQRWIGDRHESLGSARLKHTQRLALMIALLAAAALLGAVDLASAWLATLAGVALGSLSGSAAFLAVVVRSILSTAPRLREAIKRVVRALGAAGSMNLLGMLVLLLVVLVWATAVQWLTSPHNGWSWLREWLPEALGPHWRSLAQWAVVAVLPLAYIFFTRHSIETLNLSSLHNFYRARLERAYVSTGNAGRFRGGIISKRREFDASVPEMKLAKVIEGDDVELREHRPHEHGGPVHLVNCCINQTVDDRTDTYNADRKGIALTVSALGAETGTGWPRQPANGQPVPGRLSMWAAISGAAASTGMGSQTSPGTAAMLFISGLRLGFWHPTLGSEAVEQRKIRPKLIAAEALARFPGLRSAQWYLSDGGHFDNTGVYALLKRRLPVIVLADCGADPHYRFDDVENLVRKAAIDYATFIRFVTPPAAGGMIGQDELALREAIAMPADIVPGEGKPWLLLARLEYPDRPPGVLVVIKPRLVPGAPLDIAGYARRNSVFPQQTTGDQFFSEEQWEAYHQLGVRLARQLTPEHLRLLLQWGTT